MTPLRRQTTSAPTATRTALLVCALLVTGALAGCIGDTDDSDGAASAPGFKLFLAAIGNGSAEAGLENPAVDLAGDAERRFLTVQQRTVDLGALAADGTAVLVANGAELNGTANQTLVNFAYLDLGEENLTDAPLTIPLEYPVGPDVEATITLDLEASATEGEPRIDNMVVEQAGTRIKAITASDLEDDGPREVPPLPTPRIVTTSATNDTAPSFQVNDDINFTYEIDPSNASIRNVFWSFGDGRTTTGESVQHAYRTPGFYLVRVIVEGASGQQATANTTVEAYHVVEGSGNVGAGTGGTGAIQDRDVKNHTVEIPGNFTAVSVRLEQSPSGGLCQDDTCAPSNVHVELYNADGELMGENTTSDEVKWINVTGLMHGGDWTLRVKGDQGAAVGYSYEIEAHYLGLCAEAGGVAGFECPGEPEPIEQGDSGSLP